VHPVAAQPADQRVQHVDRGAGVVEGPVAGQPGGLQPAGEGGQLVVGHFVADQYAPGHGRGVEHDRLGPRVSVLGARRLQEPGVVRRVVSHPHRVAGELQEGRQHRLEARRRGDHGLGDPGQDGDERRDPLTRVDQRRELAEQLAALHLDRADLGDAGAVGRAAGRFQVDHDERGREQRARPRVVEEGVERLLVIGLALDGHVVLVGLLHRGPAHRFGHGRHGTSGVRHFAGGAPVKVVNLDRNKPFRQG
jgi:hypothetical protein